MQPSSHLQKKRTSVQRQPNLPFLGTNEGSAAAGHISFPSRGIDAALTPHQRFHGWELQGENGFGNLDMLHADLFFLLVKKRHAGIPEVGR